MFILSTKTNLQQQHSLPVSSCSHVTFQIGKLPSGVFAQAMNPGVGATVFLVFLTWLRLCYCKYHFAKAQLVVPCAPWCLLCLCSGLTLVRGQLANSCFGLLCFLVTFFASVPAPIRPSFTATPLLKHRVRCFFSPKSELSYPPSHAHASVFFSALRFIHLVVCQR